MKTRLLISSLCAIAISASAQFTSNRLAICRVGNGGSITNNRTSAVFIDEYLTSSANQTSPTYTIPVATSTNNGNYRLTSIMRSSASAFQLEGMSGLSPDGNYLAIIGYDQEIGGTVDNSTLKVVGLINAQGDVNTTTTLSGNSPARAITPLSGNAVYSSILSGGIRYSTIGSSTSTQISSYVGNARSYIIFNNTLYCANNASQIPFYNNLPTSTVSSRSGDIVLPGISNINQIVLFDADGNGAPDIIYAANDGTSLADAGLHKFKLIDGSWEAKGFIKISGVTDGLKSITGKVVNHTDIELYATTWGNLSTTPKIPSQLLKIVDADAESSALNNTDNVPIVLAEAPSNTIFRSVTFTPGTAPETTLPVKLTSFKGKKKFNGIALNWTTASEQNNSHFEILRATNVRNFVKIGEVKGHGNRAALTSYSFFDSKPQSGTNYYQLKQIDLDGKSEKSKIIAVDFDLQQSLLKVWQPTPQTLTLTFNAQQQGTAQVIVADLNGRKLYNGNSAIDLGANEISLPVQLQKGIYLISVNTGTAVLNTKFLK